MAELNSKPWWKSKMIWYNLALAFVSLGNEFAPILDVIRPETADVFRPYLILAGAVGNTILRLVTAKPVTL